MFNIKMTKNIRITLVVFFLLLVTGYTMPPACVAFSYLCMFYFAIKNNYETLLYFICFIIFQNIILVICANRLGGTWTTLLSLSKEIMLYVCICISLFRTTKVKKRSLLFLSFLLLVLYSFLISNAGLYAKIVSVRQMFLPYVCFYFGAVLNLKNNDVEKICRYIVTACVFIGIAGMVEFFIFRNHFWYALPVYQYEVNKGTTFRFYNGVPLNFYTWDYVDIIHIVVRRMVSIFVDPLITGHFLTLGFVLAGYVEKRNKTRILTQLFLLLCALMTLSKGVFVCLIIYGIWQMLRKQSFKNIIRFILFSFVGMGAGLVAAGQLAQLLPRSSIGIHFNGFINGFINSNIFGNGLGKSGVMTRILTSLENTLAAESYIGVLVSQIGLIGVLVFGCFFLGVIIQNFKDSKKFGYTFSFKMAALLSGLLIESMFSESSIGIVATGMYFVFNGVAISVKKNKNIQGQNAVECCMPLQDVSSI